MEQSDIEIRNPTKEFKRVENGKSVKKIQILHDDDLPDVKMASGETEIPAAIELNALEELFNNIGRFSPGGLGQ